MNYELNKFESFEIKKNYGREFILNESFRT